MIEFYPQIRLVHIAAVLTSGLIFLLRGALVQVGRGQWALAPVPRYLSYCVDTVLLTAALALLTVLPSATFANGWLAVKLVLLPAYIVCGWLALRRSGTGRPRTMVFAGALAIYAIMFVVARRHDPFGPLRWLLPA